MEQHMNNETQWKNIGLVNKNLNRNLKKHLRFEAEGLAREYIKKMEDRFPDIDFQLIQSLDNLGVLSQGVETCHVYAIRIPKHSNDQYIEYYLGKDYSIQFYSFPRFAKT